MRTIGSFVCRAIAKDSVRRSAIVGASMNNCSVSCQEQPFRYGTYVHHPRNILRRMKKTPVKSVFAANVAALMKAADINAPAVAEKAGITARGIHYILDKARSPSIETAEAIANVFGFTAADLLKQDFDAELLRDGRLDRLIRAFASADDEGRRVMESTADYIARRQEAPANDPKHPGKKQGNGQES
jgi:transcriptional regulator with XRE-family HTH domain